MVGLHPIEEGIIEGQVFRVPAEKVGKAGEDAACRLGLGLRGVDHADTLGTGCGDFVETPVYVGVEGITLAFHAVRRMTRRPLQAHLGAIGCAHEHGALGIDPLACEFVRRPDEIQGKPAAVALVGKRGIAEAVAEDHGTAFERRGDLLADQLGACRLEDQQLGLVGQALASRIEHDGAQRLACSGAARLADAQHLGALGSQGIREEADMGGFTRAFPTFEGDEHAGSCRLGQSAFLSNGIARDAADSFHAGLPPCCEKSTQQITRSPYILTTIPQSRRPIHPRNR